MQENRDRQFLLSHRLLCQEESTGLITLKVSSKPFKSKNHTKQTAKLSGARQT
jgi:hypothetical protein